MSNTKTATLGFTIENRAGIDVLVWEAGGCQPATSAEVAMWKALSAVQQPVVREPLTVQEVEQLLAQWSYELHGDRARYLVRMTEAAHGITQKGGSDG